MTLRKPKSLDFSVDNITAWINTENVELKKPLPIICRTLGFHLRTLLAMLVVVIYHLLGTLRD